MHNSRGRARNARRQHDPGHRDSGRPDTGHRGIGVYDTNSTSYGSSSRVGNQRSRNDISGRAARVGGSQPRDPQQGNRSQKVALTKPENHFVIGRNAVLESLRFNGDRVVRLFHVDVSDARVAEALKLAEELKIKSLSVTNQALSDALNSDSHQGIALESLPHLKLSVEELCMEAEANPQAQSILVAVDGVTDPQNLGAILRACECFGVRALIFSRNRVAPITPTVTKASAGASELVPLVSVPNLAQALEVLKGSGYWVLATSLGEDARPMSSVKLPEKTVLVLGSEGRGVQRLVRDRADFSVFIPMLGKIDSLNVSQAAATFLYEISRQLQAK